MSTRIILRKSGRTIFTFKCKQPKKSKYGQVDIMIDAGNKLYFEHVVAGDFFRHYVGADVQINSISWHGFYESISKTLLNTPVINVKSGKSKIDQLWHLGTINQDEPYAVPICSLYVPDIMNLENTEISSYNLTGKIKYEIIDLDDFGECRADIFVTPKNISAQQVLDSTLGIVYKVMDVGTINDEEGKLSFLEESKRDEECKLYSFEDENGHWIILRIVGRQFETEFAEKLNNTFSLLLHDPNHIYNRIADRLIMVVDPDTEVETIEGEYVMIEPVNVLSAPQLLRSVYEKELQT